MLAFFTISKFLTLCVTRRQNCMRRKLPALSSIFERKPFLLTIPVTLPLAKTQPKLR